jgi:hypothetical protein
MTHIINNWVIKVHSSGAAGALFMTKQPLTLHVAATITIMLTLTLAFISISTDVIGTVTYTQCFKCHVG